METMLPQPVDLARLADGILISVEACNAVKETYEDIMIYLTILIILYNIILPLIKLIVGKETFVKTKKRRTLQSSSFHTRYLISGRTNKKFQCFSG